LAVVTTRCILAGAMRKEYDFSKARPNPYAKRLKRSVTIRIDEAPTSRRRLAKRSTEPKKASN
jgi:hypothetical protein